MCSGVRDQAVIIDSTKPVWGKMGEWTAYQQHRPNIGLYYDNGWHVIDGQSAYFCSLIEWWEGDEPKPIVDIAEFINYTLNKGYGIHILPLEA